MNTTEPEPRLIGTGAEQFLRLPEGDIHIRRDGPHDAPALLLIHGSGASVTSWDPLVPLLSGAHHVIRLDLLGLGRSAKPETGDYSTPAQARRAAALLDRLGVASAVVAGHSSGGCVATALAERRPDLVSALALINTGPNLDTLIAQRMPFNPAQWPDLTDDQIRSAMATAFSPGYEPPRHFIDELRALTFHSFAATTQATTDYLEQRSIPDRLTAIGKPVLVIFGEDDRRWRSDLAVPAYRAVPGTRVEVLPGIGHSPNIEDPPRVAGPLLAFTD